jgi:membrane-bound metal-dependent hydrolase YbcI (DUF457 family)
MPSPIGHLLAGAAVYAGGTKPDTRSTALLVIALVGSIVPDLDFLPGILIGDLGEFHHGISHSFAFATLFGAVIFVLAHAMDKTLAHRASAYAVLAYSSHVILDFVNVNMGTRGVPLLWPFSQDEFGVNLRLFGYFFYDETGIRGVFHWRNLTPVARELLVLGSIVLLLLRKERIAQALLARRRRRYQNRPAHDTSRGAET